MFGRHIFTDLDQYIAVDIRNIWILLITSFLEKKDSYYYSLWGHGNYFGQCWQKKIFWSTHPLFSFLLLDFQTGIISSSYHWASPYKTLSISHCLSHYKQNITMDYSKPSLRSLSPSIVTIIEVIVASAVVSTSVSARTACDIIYLL